MTTWCVWACGLNSLVYYSNVRSHYIQEGNVTTNKGDLNQEHPFARFSGFKRGSDITEGDITKVSVYSNLWVVSS